MRIFENCCYCGKKLPDRERKMGCANHFDCWHEQVMEDRGEESREERSKRLNKELSEWK